MTVIFLTICDLITDYVKWVKSLVRLSFFPSTPLALERGPYEASEGIYPGHGQEKLGGTTPSSNLTG